MIFEIKDILEVIPHLKEECWVFFDIDNTVVESVHEFGSISWEKFFFKEHISLGHPESVAQERSSMFWGALQAVSPARFVQKEILEIFDSLAQKKIQYHFLTARCERVLKITEEQLSFLDASTSSPSRLPLENNKYAIQKGKIIFCNDNPKGIVLKSFLESHQITPSKIVFVDDHLEHLVNVQNTLSPDISFVGLRYGYLDEKVKNFKPDQTTQLIHQAFHHPEAIKLLLKGLSFGRSL